VLDAGDPHLVPSVVYGVQDPPITGTQTIARRVNAPQLADPKRARVLLQRQQPLPYPLGHAGVKHLEVPLRRAVQEDAVAHSRTECFLRSNP